MSKRRGLFLAMILSLIAVVSAVAAVTFLEKQVPGEYSITLVGDIGIYARLGDITHFDQPMTYFNLTEGQVVFSMVNEASNAGNFTVEVQDSNNVTMIFLWNPDGWTATEYPTQGIELLPNEVAFLSAELGDTSLVPQGTYSFTVTFRAE